jgi:TolB-like protein/DNA-binding winged helix-turn-helix (wHTH) protein/tetratricopeptide (TPR) repeat protein
MEGSVSTGAVVRFGIFELDASSGELRRRGLKIRLPEQSFQILRVLLDSPGDVVTREELRQRLWTSDTFVDFDVGLNSAVRKLREALDDSAENPRFVETLPKRGYRFIASVTPATPAAIADPTAGATETQGARFHPAWIAGAVLIAVTIATLAFARANGWWERTQTGSAAGHIRALAVLPFHNLTEDPAQEYFVDGMTDALTTDLAQVGGFDVISRTSAMQYKGAKKLVPAIGQELNVDALLQGSVIRSGQYVRITAQLIHAATDRHIWARSYEGEVKDVIALQQQIARTVAGLIQGRVVFPSPARGGQRSIAINPAAYDTYLKGIFAQGQGSYEGFRTAVAYFEAAVATQPDFAAAYAALAQTQHQFLFVGPLSPRETMPKAAAAAQKAVALDATLAQAHRVLGGILHHFYWQWAEGDKAFERARELSNAVEDRAAGVPALIRSGRFDEAIAVSERARTNDPLSFNAYIDLAAACRAAGQYDRALAAIRRALEINPRQTRANFQLGVTYMFMGRLNDAITEFEAVVKSPRGSNPRFQAYLGYAYAAAGRAVEARRILKQLESRARQQYVSSFGIALIYDALGEKEPAMAAFEQAYQDRAVEFAQMSQYPSFETIASHPRFQELMGLIGLPRARTRT